MDGWITWMDHSQSQYIFRITFGCYEQGSGSRAKASRTGRSVWIGVTISLDVQRFQSLYRQSSVNVKSSKLQLCLDH